MNTDILFQIQGKTRVENVVLWVYTQKIYGITAKYIKNFNFFLIREINFMQQFYEFPFPQN